MTYANIDKLREEKEQKLMKIFNAEKERQALRVS